MPKAFNLDESQISNRSRSVEAAERLIGSTAFRMPNRHRTIIEPAEAQQAEPTSVLRHRGDNKVDSKDFLPN